MNNYAAILCQLIKGLPFLKVKTMKHLIHKLWNDIVHVCNRVNNMASIVYTLPEVMLVFLINYLANLLIYFKTLGLMQANRIHLLK